MMQDLFAENLQGTGVGRKFVDDRLFMRRFSRQHKEKEDASAGSILCVSKNRMIREERRQAKDKGRRKELCSCSGAIMHGLQQDITSAIKKSKSQQRLWIAEVIFAMFCGCPARGEQNGI